MVNDILANAWWFILLLCSIFIGLRGMCLFVDEGYELQVRTGKKPTRPSSLPKSDT